MAGSLTKVTQKCCIFKVFNRTFSVLTVPNTVNFMYFTYRYSFLLFQFVRLTVNTDPY
jgi:hypothetical protein